MAIYETELVVPVDVGFTFDFVCDFSHAVRWDPRVSRASRIDPDEPIGVGTRFVLDSPAPWGSMALPYEIVEYDRPHWVALEGQTWFARYRDDIYLASSGSAESRLTYHAQFDLRGPLRLGSLLMSPYFRRIGDDATRGIPNAVATAARPEPPS